MTEISIRAEKIFEIAGWPVTNAVLLSLAALAVLVLIAIAIRRNLEMIPGKLQSVFELLLEEILKIMDAVLGSRHLSEKYLPIVAAIFLFILTSNWLGLLPIIGPIGITERAASHSGGDVFIPLFRSPASDLNFTIALAVISVFSVNFLGIAAIGFGRHFGKFFNFKNPILSFTGLLEFISEFVKIISYSFRLFGNVFAGEVLLVIVGSLVPYILPLPFIFLEIFVGFIQASIFAILTLVFIAMAVSEEPAH
ncbi:MAG: F0F1 ATP synthase subunit A [Candidatus Sungbacteria bacterium]|nr:F0F1 ATP synthase subunit A [Candidatus Sungbacteria bacterium]